MKTLIIIPARYHSSRLPGKPLRKLNNKELMLWVLDACSKLISKKVKLVVATDHRLIHNFVKKNNYQSIMTSSKCLTGTDRVAEVSKKINSDIYINVQGDEPLINLKDIKKIINAKKIHPNKVICGYSRLNKNENDKNRNIPKVVLNSKNELIYISRSSIPGSKKQGIKITNLLKQVCVYGFSKKDLKLFSSKTKTPLEKIEDIEILRFIELDKKVKMVKLSQNSYAVDTFADIKRVEKILKK